MIKPKADSCPRKGILTSYHVEGNYLRLPMHKGIEQGIAAFIGIEVHICPLLWVNTLWKIINGIVGLISLSGGLLLVYRNTADFM